MEDIIETKLMNLVTEATITDVTDNHPLHIDTMLQDWDNIEDYPVVIVICAGIDPTAEQIMGITQTYDCYIFILVAKETEAEVKLQRRTIRDRIVSKLRNNHNLDRLTDEDGAERVCDSSVGAILFSTEGYAGNYLGTARIHFTVLTDRVKPY